MSEDMLSPTQNENLTNSIGSSYFMPFQKSAGLNMVFNHFKNIIDEPTEMTSQDQAKGIHVDS